jgi:tRNA threonylcarbamoyladenosine biosynthesis protein TsaE
MQTVFKAAGFTEADLPAISKDLLKHLPIGVLLFDGPMGAGKTTLIKGMCAALGVVDQVSSPTYSLVNEYATAEGEVLYHFDLYRLEAEEEAYDFGVEEYLHSGHWCFIEWPEKIRNLLPEQYASLKLEVLPSGERRLTLSTTHHE